MVDLKKGDVVQLKSGGPHMTVDQVSDGNKIKCIWFVQTELKVDYFNVETLDKIDQSQSSIFVQNREPRF